MLETLYLCLCITLVPAQLQAFLEKSSQDLDGLIFSEIPPAEVAAIASSSVSIPCSTNHKSAYVSWYFNNKQITQEKIDEKGHLHIKKVTEENTGVYNCFISDKGRTIAAPSTHVWIANETTLWTPVLPPLIKVRVNSVLRLACAPNSAKSLQPPGITIRWKKNLKYLTESNRIYMPSLGILHIMNVKIEDGGTYSCEASFKNMNGVVLSPPTKIEVQYEELDSDMFDGEDAFVIRVSENRQTMQTPSIVDAIPHSSALLECISNDKRRNPHDWMRFDGKPIPNNIKSIVAQGSLLLQDISVDDAGVYKCLSAYNKDEKPLKLVRLVVQRPPKVNFTGPQIVRNGLHPNFNCVVEGIPEPSVEILKNGLKLPQGFNKRITRLKPEIRNQVTYLLAMHYAWKADEGLYQCIARNTAGVASEAIILLIENVEKFPKPRNVRADEVTSRSILFRWERIKSFKENPEKEGYIVRFHPENGKTREEVLSPLDDHIEYSSLLPETNHTFIIHSFSAESDAMNISDPSYVHQMTKVERPSESPAVSFSLENEFLKLTWKPLSLAEAGGIILDQKIQWRTHDNLKPFETSVSPETDEFVITGVDVKSISAVVVRPRTSAGYPLNSKWNLVSFDEPISSNGVLDPQRVELCLTSNDSSTILMKWNHHENLDKEIFNIQLLRDHKPVKTLEEVASKRQHLFTKLESGCYIASLNVISREFSSVKSRAYICTKVPESFSPDQNYRMFSSKVTNITSDSIHVAWKILNPNKKFFIVEIGKIHYLRPYDSLGSISDKNYDLATLPDGELDATNCYVSQPFICRTPKQNILYEIMETSILIVTCHSTSFSNRLPATTYRIRIIAANFSIYGLPSTPLFVTTLDGLPSPPTNFVAEPLTASSVNITWSPPANPNGRLTTYDIVYSSDKTNWALVTVPYHTSAYILKGLISNTVYHIKIAASTSSGRGEPLESVICIPAELSHGLSAEMIGLCVIAVFVAITCVVLVYLCRRMYTMRQGTNLARQVNYSPQIVYLNDHQGTNQSDLPGNSPSRNNSNTSPVNQAIQNHFHAAVRPNPEDDSTLTRLLPPFEQQSFSQDKEDFRSSL